MNWFAEFKDPSVFRYTDSPAADVSAGRCASILRSSRRVRPWPPDRRGSIGWFANCNPVRSLARCAERSTLTVDYGWAICWCRVCGEKGYGTAGLKWLTQELVRQLPGKPLYAAVDTRNTASIRVLQKAGFRALRTEPAQVQGTPSVDHIFIYKEGCAVPQIQIRAELPDDFAAIDQVVVDAFRDAPHSSHTEQRIVAALRAAGKLLVSKVATEDSRIVGHVAVSPVEIDGRDLGWYGLGPVAVLPEHQGRGIGSALVMDAILDLTRIQAGWLRRTGRSQIL